MLKRVSICFCSFQTDWANQTPLQLTHTLCTNFRSSCNSLIASNEPPTLALTNGKLTAERLYKLAHSSSSSDSGTQLGMKPTENMFGPSYLDTIVYVLTPDNRRRTTSRLTHMQRRRTASDTSLAILSQARVQLAHNRFIEYVAANFHGTKSQPPADALHSLHGFHALHAFHCLHCFLPSSLTSCLSLFSQLSWFS